jgi:hypothetical protein
MRGDFLMASKNLVSISKSTLWQLLVGAIGVIYAVLHFFLKIPESINAGLMIVLLLLLLEKFFEIDHRLTRFEDGTSINSLIKDNEGIFRELVLIVHKKMSTTIQRQNGGFMLSDADWAIDSYAKFWDLLVKQQKAQSKDDPLTVEAVHSCSIDIFTDHYLAKSLLLRQKDFCDAGGKITRILCGYGNPTAKFQRAYTDMKNAGIKVLYLDIVTSGVRHSFGWDFLRVRETNKLVIWDSSYVKPGEVMSKVIYTTSETYTDTNVNDLWKEILKNSIPFPQQAQVAGI